MATDLRTLERQINQLQRQVEQQKKEADRIRQQLVADNRRQLDEYQAQMRSTLDAHDSSVQQEYERLLRQYQNSVDQEIQNEQLQMDMQYQNLLASTKAKEQEWLEKSREMEELITQLRQSTENKAKVSKQEAYKYMAEAAALYKGVEGSPHDKFYPRRLNSFYTAICEGHTLYDAGLFEATIAVAISARTGLSRLKFDTDEAYSEWQSKYYIWKNRTGLLHLQLKDEIQVWFENINGSGKPNKEQEKKIGIEINYWSQGEYGELSNRIAEMGNEIGKVEKNGEVAYLKTIDSIDTEKIEDYIKELDQLANRFNRMKLVYKNRYRASCQRSEWGELIIDYFVDELNLEWLENIGGFRPVEAENSVKLDYKQYMEMQYGSGYDLVDTRDWLEIIFENSMGTRIMLYIVPYEKNTDVENRFVLYIDFEGAEDLDYARQVFNHIAEALELDDAEELVTFTNNVSDLTMNPNLELRATGKLIEKRIQERTR